MTKSNKLSLLGIGFMMVAGALAARADDKPATLAYTYKEGEVTRYKATISTSVMNMDIIVKQTSKHVIKKLEKNGNVVIEEKNEGTVVTVGGSDMEQPAQEKPVVITRDKVGKLVELKYESTGQEFMAPEIQKLSSMVAEVILPGKAVKEGDSWSTEMDNPVVKDKKFSLKSTFLGIEKVDGKEYWKVKQTASAETDATGAKTSFEMTHWLDVTNGQTLKVDGTVKDLPTQAGSISWTMKIEKLKEEKAKEEKKP